MEIIFNCPNCDQELSVDGEGAGTEIKCPTCGEEITIPNKPTETSSSPPPPTGGAQPVNPIASSAAAKIEMHLKVPVRDKPSESLVKKSGPVLGTATAKSSEKKLRVRTIRRATCLEAGHDRFDEKVTDLLSEIGEARIISIHTFSYDHVDVGTQKILMDVGVMVVYRG